MTGEQIESEIFLGPTYYMRLKHMVKDKINYRALGPRTALTKQPVSGRANDGGLRIGEMERDSVISHGISDFLRESMMERGDKYYMAVCNTTGMLSIYNPSKNLFMSPMADGPIKFTGSLDGVSTNIENITKYGRDFSVVCVPYSFKLLLQELQTINIQMRIITEDNIQQLENMLYSNNIDKLTFQDNKTMKSITEEIMAQLNKGKKTNAWLEKETQKTPSLTPTTPELSPELSPEILESSPQFPEGSPAYVPRSDEINKIDDNSPEYNPYSPSYSPETDENTGGNIDDNLGQSITLSEQANSYEVGDDVLYRGEMYNQGETPKIWKIKDIGDKFLTIENENNKMIKVVTANDIYTPQPIYNNIHQNTGENMYQNMSQNINQINGGEYNNQVNDLYYGNEYIPETNNMNMRMQDNNIPASIHFAPVIKVTGGNDFSTEQNKREETMNENQSQPISFMNEQIHNEEKSQPELLSNIQSSQKGGVDFNKLIIKKSE
jgi:hypothetical protein